MLPTHRSLPRHRPVNIVGAHHALPPRLEFRLQAAGAFTTLCRVNAELRTKRPLTSGAVRGCAHIVG